MSEGGGPEDIDPGPRSLAALEARLRRDLTLLVQPARAWTPADKHGDGENGYDVAIVGAGMAGLTAAFALMRIGLRNIMLFDSAAEGQEGPWVTYARMETLRSPKHLAGPALGLSNLTFRAWFEAQFGIAAWEALGKIPRGQWMDYLRWYRRVLSIPVTNRAALTNIQNDGDRICLTFDTPVGPRNVFARRAVLATGRDGLGGPYIPPTFRDLPPERCTHSSTPFDPAVMKGKRLAVIGAGASAVDNAAEALEAGAAHVDMLVRRPDIPRINKGMGVSNPGLNLGFLSLTPERKWAINDYVATCQTPPPRDSMLRASRHPNFAVFMNCPILDARGDGDAIVLATPRGERHYDAIILGTGFTVDWAQRPELSRLAESIALWRHRYTPPGGEDHEFADHPFLGPWFEFTERDAGTAPWVSRVLCFNYASTMSQYKLTGDVPAISDGATRLAEGIARSLFVEDYDVHFRRLLDYDQPELQGDEWTVEREDDMPS